MMLHVELLWRLAFCCAIAHASVHSSCSTYTTTGTETASALLQSTVVSRRVVVQEIPSATSNVPIRNSPHMALYLELDREVVHDFSPDILSIPANVAMHDSPVSRVASFSEPSAVGSHSVLLQATAKVATSNLSLSFLAASSELHPFIVARRWLDAVGVPRRWQPLALVMIVVAIGGLVLCSILGCLGKLLFSHNSGATVADKEVARLELERVEVRHRIAVLEAELRGTRQEAAQLGTVFQSWRALAIATTAVVADDDASDSARVAAEALEQLHDVLGQARAVGESLRSLDPVVLGHAQDVLAQAQSISERLSPDSEGLKQVQQAPEQAQTVGKSVQKFDPDTLQRKVVDLHDDVRSTCDEACSAAKGILDDLKTSVNRKVSSALDDLVPSTELDGLRSQAGEAVDTVFRVPMHLLLAATFAPMQLEVLIVWNRTLLYLQGPIAIVVAITAAFDMGKPCGNGFIWVWSIGLLAILILSCAARSCVLMPASRAMNDLAERGRKQSSDAEFGFMSMPLQRVATSGDDYLRALLAYDNITGSCAWTVLSWLSFMAIFWALVGVFEMGWHVLDDAKCEATHMRFMAHILGFIYMSLLFWNLIGLALWIVSTLLTGDDVRTAVLRQACVFDDRYSPPNVALATIFVLGFLLRRKEDLAALKMHLLQMDINELKERRAAVSHHGDAMTETMRSVQRNLQQAERRGPEPSTEVLACRYEETVEQAANCGVLLATTLQYVSKAGELHETASASASKLATTAHQATDGASRSLGTALNGISQGLDAASAQVAGHLGAAATFEQLALAAVAQARAAGVEPEELLLYLRSSAGDVMGPLSAQAESSPGMPRAAA